MGDDPQFGAVPDPDDGEHGDLERTPQPPPGVGLPDFSNLDFSQVDLGAMMRMLQSPGPVNWEVARQTAEWTALEGKPDPTVSQHDHDQFEDLARAAQTLVVAETGLTATFATSLRTVGPQGWVELHLVVLRPVLEAMATTLGDAMQRDLEGAEDDDELPNTPPMPGFPAGIPLGGGMLQMLAPMLLGVQAGSMIGFLAQHTLGRYDLPLPTGEAATGDEPSLCFVVPNIDAFESEWGLTRDDVRFAIALHEVVHAAIRSVPWLRARLVRTAIDYVSSYELDPLAFEAEFGDIDPSDPASLAAMTERPERVLGAMQSERQRAPREELQRLTSVIEGYADEVAARIGRRLVPEFDRIHEAVKRHRVERGEAERFIEGLLGLKLERAHYERGQAFCAGVVERAGPTGLNRLWEDESMLPTPAELDAPGLWLARIELD